MDSFFSLPTKGFNSPSIPSFPEASLYNVVKNPMEIPSFNGIPHNSLPSGFSSGQRTRACSFSSLSPVNCYSPPKPTMMVNNADMTNVIALLKLQQNIQAELFKQNMKRMFDLKNSLIEKITQQQMPVLPEPQMPVQIPSLNLNFSPVQREDLNSKVKVEPTTEEIPALERTIQPSQRKALKTQIREIINFVLDNFGRVNEVNFDKEKLKYSYDQDLVAVFDMLTAKYASTIKTKEEMVKYTLRRAFKFVKSNLKKQTNANNKGVSKTLCNKYFGASNDEISKIGNEEELLKVLLPFRKNSKNKTMNTTFINEVFASEEFCKDYQTYLNHFEGILEADNKNKIDRLANFIEECIRKRKIRDIKNYKRIPWPKVWITNTKNIASNLPNMGSQLLSSPNQGMKKLKTESLSHESSRTEDNNDCYSEASTNSHSNF